MGKYKPAVILTLALAVFLVSCKPVADTKSWVVSTLAGTGTSGTADGVATTTARFSSPQGVAVDSSGNVYVADTASHTIRKITKAGVVSTLAGTAGTATATTGSPTPDGTGTAATFNGPQGVAVDSSGNVYVADTGSHTIRKITITTSEAGVVTAAVSTLAGTVNSATATTGTPDPNSDTATSATFNGPQGVAVDSNGIVYVADTGSHTIRRIASTGTRAVTTVGGTVNSANASTTGISSPQGVAVNSDGTIVYVAGTGNNNIQKITIAADGMGTVNAFSGTITAGHADTGTDAEGNAVVATFNAPAGVAVDSFGNVFVADSGNNLIRKITSAGVVTTLAGSGTDGHHDATGTAALFSSPQGVAVDSYDDVYVADTTNNRIRKIEYKNCRRG